MKKSDTTLFFLLGGLLFGILLAGIFFIWSNFFAPRKDLNNGILWTAPTTQLTSILSPIPSPSPTTSLNSLPQSKTLSRGIQVFQTFNNCGPAALSMALSHYGISASQQELGQELRPLQHQTGDNDDKSVTLTELAKKGEQYGFIPYHRPSGDIDRVKQFIANDMPVLTRTLLHRSDDIGHYRVIKGYDDVQQIIIQDDSLQGANLTYSHDVYNALWEPFNFEYLVLVPAEKKKIAEAILGDHLNEKIAWQDALQHAEQMIAENPANMYAEFNRSVALYELGRYEESIASFEKVEQRLSFRTLWYQIEPVLAYYKLGRYDRVLTMIDQILTRHNRAYSELYYLRGLIYQQQGNEIAAREEFAQADLYNTTGSYKENVKL